MERLKKLLFLFLLCVVFIGQSRAQESRALLDGHDTTILAPSELRKYINNPKTVPLKILNISKQGLGYVYENKKVEAFNCYLTALSLAKYVPEDSSHCLVALHQNLSDFLFHSKAYYPAIRNAKEALRLLRSIDSTASDGTYILLGKIGTFYMLTEEYDSAQVYYEQAIIEANRTHLDIWKSASLNNMGMLVMKTGHLDSAMQIFHQSLKALKMDIVNDSVFALSIKDNIADNHFKMGNYNEAITIYKENLSPLKKYQDTARVLITYMDIAEAYLQVGNKVQAKTYLDSVDRIKPELVVDDLLRLEKLLKKYYLSIGSMQQAFACQDRIQEITDSVAQQTSQFLDELSEKLIYSQLDKFSKDIQIQELELKRTAQEAEIAKADARQNWMWMLVAVIGGLGLALSIFLVYRNKTKLQQKNIEMHEFERQLAEANLKNEELEREKLETELKYKKDDITDLSLYLSKLKDTNKDLLDKLNSIIRENEADTKGNIKKVVKELSTKLKLEKKNNLLRENSDKINKEFYAKLKKDYPDLTKSEAELCGLLRLNMTNKEIGALRNVSPHSVKMARYRLRKKLSLKPEEDIYLFLAAI